MNEMQKTAIAELQKTNQEFINKLSKLNSAIISDYSKYNEMHKEFMELMELMEVASGQLPFAPYNNAYAFKNSNFCRASSPCIKDSLYGTLNKEYITLSDEWMDEISLEFSNKFGELKSILQANVNTIFSLLSDIIASNSITRRLEGLQDKHDELEAITKVLWYPQSHSKQEYGFKGSSFVPPVALAATQIQFRFPFHRELLIKYDYILKTKELHPNIIDKCIGILKYINNYLPFAELKDTQDMNKTIFNNINMPNQNQIGSDNTFDGNINIG